MSHRPIQLNGIGFVLPHKTCFMDFSAPVHFGDRIAIMGRNGSGKTTLLQMIRGMILPSHGEIQVPSDVVLGYVPQIPENMDALSGGERFQKALSNALAKNPNVLCLDEPTNHLDKSKRRALMNMLSRFDGTLIVVSHDVELLRNCVNTLWHIHDGKMHVFSGGYDCYWQEQTRRREKLEASLKHLAQERKQAHLVLMREQERAKKRKLYGEKKYDGDKLALRSAQGRGALTSARNRKRISAHKQDVIEQLAEIQLPEIIKPRFSITAADLCSNGPAVAVTQGACGYGEAILKDINVVLGPCERMAIAGQNASGKSTFAKAILGDGEVFRTGVWLAPKIQDVGYLDQHYQTLPLDLCAFDIIAKIAPSWTVSQVRRHLNDFLFRKNEEVFALAKQLSGGEKARLTLAQMAAKTPKLLILDEITNNLDLETREHVIEVLREYPGAVIVISHDNDFLAQLGVTQVFDITHLRVAI